MTEIAVKILVTGDNHLDTPSTQYGTKKRERQRDLTNNFKAIMDYALESKVDTVLIAGDLFDNVRPSNTTRAWVMQQFRKLAENGTSVFVITGHHDTPRSILSGVSPLKTHGESGHITFFENPSSPEPVDIEVKGTKIRIVGLGFNPTLRPEDNPLDVKIPPPEGDVNILLLHYPITGFSGYMGDECKVRPDDLPEGYQLVIAGHFHSAQEKKIGSSQIVIPGSSERISFNEEGGEKSFSVVEIQKSGNMKIERIPLQCREMKTISVKVKDGDNINKVVEGHIDAISNPELILRIRIEGLITAETLATYRRSPLQRKGDEVCFKLILTDNETLRVEGLREIEPISSLNPDEEILAYFDARMEMADEEEKVIIQKAKAKCIQLLEEVSTQ